jgi:hypothetical protein
MKNSQATAKNFKTRNSKDYPIKLLRLPYQYNATMICRLYGDLDSQKFKVSWVPLIHYIITFGSSFNWVDILSSTLAQKISVTKHMDLGKYPKIYISSHLKDMMCLVHAYPEMG